MYYARTCAQFTPLSAKALNLTQYHVEAHLAGLGRFISDPKLIEMEINTIKGIGFSALTTEYSGLANCYRKAAAKEGIFKSKQTHREPTYYSLPKIGRSELDQAMLDPNFQKAMRVYPAYRDWLAAGGGSEYVIFEKAGNGRGCSLPGQTEKTRSSRHLVWEQ